MNLDQALRNIVQAVEPQAYLQDVEKLSGGLSYELRRLRTDSGDLVLREASNLRSGRWGLSLSDEYRLIEELFELGLPVPPPRLFDGSGTILKHPFAVYDYLPGAPFLHAGDPVAVGAAVAHQLAAIHAVDLNALTVDALPNWTDFVGDLVTGVPTTLDHSIDEALIRDALDEHWPPLPTGSPVLLHGDFWPGNVLAIDDRIVGVLDWENAAIGDPMADVAVTRLDLLWTFGASATASFTEIYESITGTETSKLPVWDLFAALRPSGDLKQWADAYPSIGRPDVTLDTMIAGHRWFLAQALAALA